MLQLLNGPQPERQAWSADPTITDQQPTVRDPRITRTKPTNDPMPAAL